MIANACLFFPPRNLQFQIKGFASGKQGNLGGLDKIFVDFDIVIQKRMLDNAKERSFDVIEFTMRANESCLTNLNFARR